MQSSQTQFAAGANAGAAPEDLATLVSLLWEIGNLKRINAANLDGSFAAELFCRAWAAICAGETVREVALRIAAQAVVAANLGAIDRARLLAAGLSQEETQAVLEKSFDEFGDVIEPELRAELRLRASSEFDASRAGLPSFVEKLVRQPRSGATKPGAARLVFDCPENHAEHCIVVGIYAVLLAPVFQADFSIAFLAALAHHFHNADLPDAGFAGEEMLGELLPKIFDNLREKCLAEVPETLRQPIRETLQMIERADAPAAKAFHAADVLDRVLQMRHHAEANQFTVRFALEELDLVHAGAIQSFHYDVLRRAKLI